MNPTPDRLTRFLTFWAPAPLYLVGVVHWVLFFNFGSITFEAYDWSKEFAYYDALQQALQQGRMPWHFGNEATYHGTDRILALPELVLSPELLLLPFMTVDEFILVHTLILYTAGFVGCLLLQRRYRLAPIPFTILFILFNFNGHITAHLASGHTMWNGYFLLPFFCLYLLEVLEQAPSFLPALKLPLVLFAMMLQGSFHMVFWCWMFLFFFILGNLHLWRQGLLMLGFSAALSLVRLLPAVVAFWNFKDYLFISGFPSLAVLVDGFTVIREHTVAYLGGIYGSLAWGEYDFYVGVLGFGLLLWLGVGMRFSKNPALEDAKYPGLDLPLAALSVLSLSDVYVMIANLPLPLVNGERVPSRFLIIPVVMLMVLSALRLQRWLNSREPSRVVTWLFVAGILQACVTLASHSYFWNVARFEKDPTSHWAVPVQVGVTARPDAVYVASVILGAVLSVIAFGAWVACFRHFRRP